MKTELQTYAALRGLSSVHLADFLHDQALEIEDVYRTGTGQARSGWTTLKRDAGLIADAAGPEEDYLSRRFGALLHVDDPKRLDTMAAIGTRQWPQQAIDATDALDVQMLAYQIDGRHEQAAGHDAFLERIERHPAIAAELVELSGLLQARSSLGGRAPTHRRTPMTPEQILSIPPRVLTQQQRERYFEDGCILLERFLPDQWVERLRTVTEQMVEESRSINKSDAKWDLEPTHTAAAPRLRRLSSPNDFHHAYWDYASAADSPLPDAIADLVGPDVKFHHSKLNFKWSKGGAEVKWHQDIPAWPHTNYTPCTAGTYLYDCGLEQGPLTILKGSHDGPIYTQYNEKGQWVGCLSKEDEAALDTSKVVQLDGPAGSVTIHHCRALHHSAPNHSTIGRPLLLNVYSNANAMPYTPNPLQSRYSGAIVRGKPALWAFHDPRPCIIPPDWSGGFTSLFAMQKEEDGARVSAGGMM